MMDLQILLALQTLREGLHGALDRLVLAVSFLGEAPLPMAAVLAVYWCFSREAGLFLIFGNSLGDFLNNLLKLTFCVYRPWIREPELRPMEGALSGATGYSFPSGHSTKAAAFFGGIASQAKKTRRLWISFACGLLVVLVMFSRNYLGVHTPQDVLAGAAVGFASVWLTRRLLCWAEAKPGRDTAVVCVGTGLCLIATAYVLLKPYPLDIAADGSLLVDPLAMQKDFFLSIGVVLGLLSGWLLERRKVRFSVQCSWTFKLLRLVTGLLIGAGLLFTLVRHQLQALLGVNWGALLGTALFMFYAVGLHPLLFTRAEALLAGRKKTAA